MAVQAELSNNTPQGPSSTEKALGALYRAASDFGQFDNISGTVALGATAVTGCAGFIASGGSVGVVVAGTAGAAMAAAALVKGAEKVASKMKSYADTISSKSVPALQRTGAALLTAFSLSAGVGVGAVAYHVDDALWGHKTQATAANTAAPTADIK